jgi:hypothetical protein
MQSKFCFIFFVSLLFPCILFSQLDTRLEAEDQILTPTYVEKLGTGNASGGNWILLKNNPKGSLELVVNNIPSMGAYKLNIYHFNDNNVQEAAFSLNGQASQTISLNASNWEYQGLAQLTSIDVSLQAGVNTFTFKRITHNLHFDYFTVTTETPTAPVYTYYVSSSGDDSNAGNSESSPWKTIEKANTATQAGGLLQPGGKVLFRRGDTFIGQLLVGTSGTPDNPIEISSYGSGEKPILTGVGANMGNNSNGDAIEVVKITNGSHIIMSDLQISNDRKVGLGWNGSGSKSYGIYVNANKWGGRSKGLTFKNIDFIDIFGVDMLNWEGQIDTDNYKAQAFFFDSDQNHDGLTSPLTPTEVGIDDVLIEDCYFYNIGGSGITSRHLGGYNSDGSTERNQNHIIRNNHFENLGGDGVVFASIYNGLVENNEYYDLGLGDKNDPNDRLFGRGEGCWIWDSWNVVVQYNKQYRNKGFGDTYGAGGHVDFYCKNVIFQYNYSEDSDGGFVEILGDSENITFRHNVSVNDGHRSEHHNYTIWLSGYVGTDKTPIPSQNSYIYNNTVYVNNPNIDTQISIFAENTYIYNNIFLYTNGSSMGIRNEDEVNGLRVDMQNNGVLEVSNNMYQGNISNTFKNLDASILDNVWPSFSSPSGFSPGDANGSSELYDLESGSLLINAGKTFTPPVFPMAGQGIFSHITSAAVNDGFGNQLAADSPPNIGASNSYNTNLLHSQDISNTPSFLIFPNPVLKDINVKIFSPNSSANIIVYDIQGKPIYNIVKEINNQEIKVELPAYISNGIYMLLISTDEFNQAARFILYR